MDILGTPPPPSAVHMVCRCRLFDYIFRVEEERRRQEALEEERKRLEKEKELENAAMVENGFTENSDMITENNSFSGPENNSFSGLADYDAGEAEKEIQKLSQMVEQINPKLHDTSNEQVDLDQLFNFLSKEVPDSIQSGSIRSSSVTGESSETPEKSSILDEIDR